MHSCMSKVLIVYTAASSDLAVRSGTLKLKVTICIRLVSTLLDE